MRITTWRTPRPASDKGESVRVPWTSLDAGLIFERDMTLLGESHRQTLEPRVFYVKAPYRNQNQIPLFDTALADFNYTQLFSENRFVGGDRFGDANQLTVAATSRILGDKGQELFRATLGQRYYFENERVALNATTPAPSRGSSDLLASVGAPGAGLDVRQHGAVRPAYVARGALRRRRRAMRRRSQKSSASPTATTRTPRI